MPQFRIKDLFLIAGLVAGAVALLADEPLTVALAATFCVVSILGVQLLGYISVSDFCRQVVKAIRHRSIRPMISRIKWLLVDAIIAVWLFATISTINYVLDSHVGQAPWFLVAGGLISPLVARWFWTRFPAET